MDDSRPVVDITSLNGVESLFRHGTRDPWGLRLAGRLTDFFVYGDLPRFTMPIWAGAKSPLDDPTLPPILAQLRSRDRKLFVPVLYEVDERRTLNPEHLNTAFESFCAWARNSSSALQRWLQLHAEPWIRNGHLARVRPRYMFDVDRLRTNPALERIASTVGVAQEDVLYAFDVILRYPLYGELVGTGSYFLAHPIRELQNLLTMRVEVAPPPSVPLSPSDAVAGMVRAMTLDEYTSFLHEARGVIRDRKIHTLKAGALDIDTIREVASVLGLPARLKASGRAFGVVGGIITIGGAWPFLGPAAAVAGGAVSVASVLWTGTVGPTVSRMTWLRWAFEWDVERQASDA